MIVIATDGPQARKSKHFALEHMIGTEQYGAAGVQLGIYFCVSGTAGMGVVYDLPLDLVVLGFPCAAEPA